jgi:hypothetical protein
MACTASPKAEAEIECQDSDVRSCRSGPARHSNGYLARRGGTAPFDESPAKYERS